MLITDKIDLRRGNIHDDKKLSSPEKYNSKICMYIIA